MSSYARFAKITRGSESGDPVNTVEFTERSSDPPDPSEGKSVIWLSDGTDSGIDGTFMVKTTANSTTTTRLLSKFPICKQTTRRSNMALGGGSEVNTNMVLTLEPGKWLLGYSFCAQSQSPAGAVVFYVKNGSDIVPESKLARFEDSSRTTFDKMWVEQVNTQTNYILHVDNTSASTSNIFNVTVGIGSNYPKMWACLLEP
jgi:hypothetical protein